MWAIPWRKFDEELTKTQCGRADEGRSGVAGGDANTTFWTERLDMAKMPMAWKHPGFCRKPFRQPKSSTEWRCWNEVVCMVGKIDRVILILELVTTPSTEAFQEFLRLSLSSQPRVLVAAYATPRSLAQCFVYTALFNIDGVGFPSPSCSNWLLGNCKSALARSDRLTADSILNNPSVPDCVSLME